MADDDVTLVEVPDRQTRLDRAAERAAREAVKAAQPARVAKPLPELDVDWHTDPDARVPGWTRQLEAKFLRALYRGRGSLKYACQKCDVPFRALVERLEGEPGDPRLAARVAWVQRLYREQVYEEFQERVLTDKARPANIIFDLKSRDARYTPVEARTDRRVQIAIQVADPTFKVTSPAKVLPAEASA